MKIYLLILISLIGLFCSPNQTKSKKASNVDSETFDEVYAKLKQGPVYNADVPKGKIIRTHKINGIDHHYLIFVPLDYDPEKRYPILWDLHGGMGQPEWKKPDGSWSGWGAVLEEDFHQNYIVVAPAGWWDSMWWTGSQVDNFKAIMEEVKRTWNIHENRVMLMGNSDGAVAAWFYAFRYPDPWVFYTGHVGFPARLTNNSMRADGQMHLSNLEGQRFILHNGVKDRIIDINVVRKYLEVFKSINVQIDYKEHPDRGHDLYLSQEDAVKPFILFNELRRDPLPEKLSWTTERVDRYNRRFWLVIEELDSKNGIDKSNILPRIVGRNVPNTPPFDPKPWGQVRLERNGNQIIAKTIGVKKFRLLLSPEEFDFTQPVQILVNDEEVLNTKLEKSVETLLKWHAVDKDREMLFAAEVLVEVQQ